MSNTSYKALFFSKEYLIALLSICGIAFSLLFSFLDLDQSSVNFPLLVILIIGGGILTFDLLKKAIKLEFGADLLAGISIVTSLILGHYMAGSIVVFMLSGGEALERLATSKASKVLEALSKRMPQQAHRRTDGKLESITLNAIVPGDELVILPQEICPVDGVVIEGHGEMDEAFLTGEPYHISKTPGSQVISGSINGQHALIIKAQKRASESRYAQIANVMQEAQSKRLQIRRIGDQLGAWFTPFALILAGAAWYISHDATRFLSVLVVATPCPLLIAIPVAIIGSISLAASRGIIIKDASILERIDHCTTIILDKTGTLTYGMPRISSIKILSNLTEERVLQLAATAEQYSKHPLALAVGRAAKERLIPIFEATKIQQQAGIGLSAEVDGINLLITSRKIALEMKAASHEELPKNESGLECIMLADGKAVALFSFADQPRKESLSFISHLSHKHNFSKIMIVSGDRESEVRELAKRVGIDQIYAGQSPEQKVEIVEKERALNPTLYLGDGINDAPALMAATVGLALGHHSDITGEAAGAIILESSLRKVDELFHIARHLRRIALQSALAGMGLSAVGMVLAAAGILSPIAGALFQEAVDLFAVLNALRASRKPGIISDL